MTTLLPAEEEDAGGGLLAEFAVSVPIPLITNSAAPAAGAVDGPGELNEDEQPEGSNIAEEEEQLSREHVGLFAAEMDGTMPSAAIGKIQYLFGYKSVI